MRVNVNRDAVAGIALGIFGGAVAIYSFRSYPMGTLARMGPGMFPGLLGVALVLVSAGILARSVFERGTTIDINLRSSLFIFVSLALFAVVIHYFGIVPALLVLLLVSSAAVPGRRPLSTAVFAAAVTAAIVFIFDYLMDLNLDLFRWPM